MTNSGMDEVVTPVRTMARSATLSRRRAAYSPARMLIGTVRTSARAASCADRPMAANSVGTTGWLDDERVAEVQGDEVAHRPDVLLDERVVGARAVR